MSIPLTSGLHVYAEVEIGEEEGLSGISKLNICRESNTNSFHVVMVVMVAMMGRGVYHSQG